MKYEPPVTISLSSLNHLTASGAVPVKAALKATVVPGITSWLSGFTVNNGGSGGHKENKFAFYVSMETLEVQHTNRKKHNLSQ